MDIFSGNDVHRITDACANILDLEVRIEILNNGIKGKSFKYQFQDTQYRNSRPSHTRFAKMHVRIDSNAFLHLSPSSARIRSATMLDEHVCRFTITPPTMPLLPLSLVYQTLR